MVPPAETLLAAEIPEGKASKRPKAAKLRSVSARTEPSSLVARLSRPAAKPASSILDEAVDTVLHDGVAKREPPPSLETADTRPPGANDQRSLDRESAHDAQPSLSRPSTESAAAPSQASPSSPRPGVASPAAIPDFDALSQNMGRLLEQGSKLASAYFSAREQKAAARPFSDDVSGIVRTLGKVAEHWLTDPSRLIEAQTALSSQFVDLWASSLQRFASGPGEDHGSGPEPSSGDKRFADPEWRDNPFFDFVRRAYLIGTDWASQMVEGAESLDEPTREKARFYMRQISSAFSPSNFVPTNPELLRETIKQNGANLVRGMEMLAEDIAAGQGDLKLRQTDATKFALGVNMALTPGKVVFRNDLMELLQYAPSTETVLKRPLLIVPPWINKFYILDLNPDKSFIRWAVGQGLTVFVISWINPDARHAGKDWEAYMREGIFAALDTIATATGEKDVATIGYCVGGTLLAVALAYMAARQDSRVSSATLFTTQVDFGHAGDLKAFADEAQIRAVEAQMSEFGFLKGTKMAQAFNMLRPDDLIWSYVVNNYLKGKEPAPFDLLAWNSDSTRMPAANHSFYLRNCYLENNLTRGLMEIGGERLDLGRITIPIYNLATREDHIAPARSVFEGSRFFGGPVRYVLAGSGHIAGVVNPPSRAKYGYWLGPEPKGTFNDWLEAANQQPGSWWTDWFEWLRAQAPEAVPARQPGGGVIEPLEDAPGSYVKIRS